MPLLLRRLAAAVSAPLRRSISTARSRPPWAMVNIEAALDAPAARASFDLNPAPRASLLSVPAHFVDPRCDAMNFLVGIVRGVSCDGLLLLDFLDIRNISGSLVELAAGGGIEQDLRLFVCNPLSGQLFRLPVPDMDIAEQFTPFGLLTQSSEGSHGPPDRYVVAQVGCREGGNRKVVHRFLSETGQWEERPLDVARFKMDAERRMLINHEVLAFGDRLWWADVTWGVWSVDPFSYRPECRFVELPDCSVLPAPDLGDLAGSVIHSRHWRMGVSEGKLRFVQVSNGQKSFLIDSFSLDVESCSWTRDHGFEFAETSLDRSVDYCCGQRKPFRPWISAIDPFKAKVLYIQHRGDIIAVDMAKAEEIWRSPLLNKIAWQVMRQTSFFVPCVLPSWLASSKIPSAGTLSSNKTNCERKTLAEMLVRVDKGHKN